jgi:hypothetical protein
MDIMDKRRLVLATVPSMFGEIIGAAPGLEHNGTVGSLGIYGDHLGKCQLLLQATGSNIDPVIAHAQALSRLAPAYRLKKLIAMKAGKESSLMAAARSIPPAVHDGGCANCGGLVKRVQVINGCDLSNPVPTCTTGEYSSPYQNALWWAGLSGITSPYYALPTFPGYAGGDWNYPIDQSFYTPNLNQTFEWSWPPDPYWKPDQQQLDKSKQIGYVAGAMGIIGILWGIGAFLAAGACIPCTAAAFGFGLSAAILKWVF